MIDPPLPVRPAARAAFCCRACGRSESSRWWSVPERMFQTGGSYDYGECAACGALSLTEVPEDLARHYGGLYPAFTKCQSEPPRSWRERMLDLDPAAPGRLVRRLVPDRAARILDVGAGSGRLLHELWEAGYTEVGGIDPHLPPEQTHEQPFPLRRGTIHDCESTWDVIMYHHVLEHVPDPAAEIRLAAARLAPRGRLIIRVPLADSWARRRFETHWLQWDAPRHLWLPTRSAMNGLATASGLMVTRVIDDSRANQVWSSVLYQRGLTAARNEHVFPRRLAFLAATPWLIASMIRARWLNARGRGDQAAFILEKPA